MFLRTWDLSSGWRLTFMRLLLWYFLLTVWMEIEYRHNKYKASLCHAKNNMSSLVRLQCCQPTHQEADFPRVHIHHIFGDVLHDGLEVGLVIGAVVLLERRLQHKRGDIRALSFAFSQPLNPSAGL